MKIGILMSDTGEITKWTAQSKQKMLIISFALETFENKNVIEQPIWNLRNVNVQVFGNEQTHLHEKKNQEL